MTTNLNEAVANLTEQAREVYDALVRCVEGCETTKPDGRVFKSVYLDNAHAAEDCHHLSRHQFAGYLSVLEKAELYRGSGDDCFGQVRIL